MTDLFALLLSLVGMISCFVWLIFGLYGNRICERATAAFVMILLGFWNILTIVVRMQYLSNTSFGNKLNIAAIVCFGLITLVKIIELACCDKKYE
jgi:hypothetical protein